MKYIIIGGVAGGATAAARIRRNTEKAEIILFIRKGEYISYANCGLPYYIGGVISDRERLFVQTPESFGKRFNIDVRTRSEVTAIDVKKKEVTVRTAGKTYTESYDKLLLSPGASPVRPPLPGIETEGIFTLRNVNDTDHIKSYMQQKAVKHAVIVGGGFIGIPIMRFLILFLFIFSTSLIQAQEVLLESKIKKSIENVPAQVGVAIIINGKDTITVNNECHYPLMSVMKYPQALAVLHYLHQHNQPLSTKIFIPKEALLDDTYSPLRDKYPEGNIYMPIAQLLDYTIQKSDNNACDILFNYTGGVLYTDSYIRSLGINNFSISKTEDDMHKDLAACYENWSTPLEIASLTDMLFSKELFPTEYQNFLKETMLNCQIGTNRLPAPLLDTTARIGHKTGTSDRNVQGELIGINDVGFILLPDGKRYTIAVLVKNSKESMADTEKIIANISGIVYHHLVSEKNISNK